MPDIKPDFFIVGAPRCGTTAMYEYLTAHPDVYMPELKEPHYFGSDLVFIEQPYGFRPVRELGAYLALFDDWQGESRIGEASVMYLYSRTAAQEIKDFMPEARIIIMLRDPVEEMYSNYYTQRYTLNEHLPTFEAALEAEAERRAGQRLSDRTFSHDLLAYRGIVRYAEQVQRYFDVFGRDRVHVIIYDDFRADTPASYRSTLEFLEVDPTFQPDFQIVNANRVLHSYYFRKLYSNPPRWYKLLLAPGKVLIPEALRKRFNQWVYSTNVSHEKREPMDAELRRQLQQEFLPEIQRLSDLLGRDLTHWCTS